MNSPFYLPKHPINKERHILEYFYTDDVLEKIIHFAYIKPIEFTIFTTESPPLPTESSAIKLTYKRTQEPNCDGVSKYELVEPKMSAIIEFLKKDGT